MIRGCTPVPVADYMAVVQSSVERESSVARTPLKWKYAKPGSNCPFRNLGKMA